jgi:hypothetical protein
MDRHHQFIESLETRRLLAATAELTDFGRFDVTGTDAGGREVPVIRDGAFCFA